MPVAAYCYSMLLHPNKWTELVIDDILEIGTKLYQESISMLHMHSTHTELQFYQLAKYCVIETKKLNFQVYEPEIVGQIRSTDKKIYNINKGLQVFFKRQRAGVIKSHGLNVVVWKDKHYYFFDAKGRRKDLYVDVSGAAVLAHVYDIPALSTILLKHSDLGNRPFTISKISVTKILEKDEPEEDGSYDVMPERSHYNIIDENKAVVLGSFDLADLCFDFSRNKQAIAMATVCLVYSRITPPSSWHRKTIDKIMIIGNQLYLELVESENLLEMMLEHIPAIFTLGPYVVEILIYANIYADLMIKKGVSVLQKCLEKFFSTNTMAIVFIDKAALAIWTQRNMFYCFDPYSRNAEAFKCRNGNACVSMNSTIESVARTVATNFDNPNDIFYIHALKVVKVHRDPEPVFPKTMTMDDASPDSFKECRVKKSKRKAVHKPVTADFTESAVKELTPWDYLDQSIIEVGSTVGSLTPEQLPHMVHKFPSKIVLKPKDIPPYGKAIDLDSPSLSDTQIEPDRPEPMKNEGELDMTSWELTMEELELEDGLEEDQMGQEGEGVVDEEIEAYMAMNEFAQVQAESTGGYYRSAQVNTDITVSFLPIPRDILPLTDIRLKQKLLKQKEIERRRQMAIMQSSMGAPIITQSMELAKDSNFVDLPDNTQIILGSSDITNHGGDVDYMAPFICMMASAVAQKYLLSSWSKEIIDYTLRSGAKLYSLAKVRYDQVPILDVPKVSLGTTKFSILTEYLHDTVLKQRVLEETLIKVLFKKHECGLIATPSYACTVFLKNRLFYLFDCFGCNEVGLGEGPGKGGVACLSRFKNIHDLCKRIIYNKTKRDDAEEYEFSRFVVSACTSKPIPPKPGMYKFKDEDAESGADTTASETSTHPLRTNRVGYQLNEDFLTLQGTKALEGRNEIDYDELKRDHFVCICACLLLLNYPILRWDTKRVDYVIDQGNHIYDHAENLSISEKRIIRNILIYQNFFDIIITSVKIPGGNNRNLAMNLEWITSKRDYVLLQFPNCCYVIYKHNKYFHVFDPYPCTPNGAADESDEGKAGWCIFNTVQEMTSRIKKQIIKDGEHFLFYTFEVTSVSKAPKSLIVGQKLLDYEMNKADKPEKTGAPFNERDVWLLKDPLPWSRVRLYSANNTPRGRGNSWHCWDIEFPNDLYSLIGTFHQRDERFSDVTRGKQTLANIVVAIGMTEIYPLAEWTAAVLDSILISGDKYFLDCINQIKEKDYQFDTDDLQPKCVIFPYTFEVTLIPVIDGTMFIMRPNQFNLYKALKVFFDNYDKRKGMLCCDQGRTEKRFVGLGKTKMNEYFMFDCQINGLPMFMEHRGAAYILRCKTLKRLLYVLTLTLRGGDFFIFEIDISNIIPIQ
ncbi:hypothetical protein RN001_010966 [Aquatica leii]|uniref:Uncharacterized protein n=1 Tax=Aquatica leii TaxID=1421715 RepID=A0AAN7SQK8_9COLE|nr:hypothetical protein RN001_010966 [Aquatica leii]